MNATAIEALSSSAPVLASKSSTIGIAVIIVVAIIIVAINVRRHGLKKGFFHSDGPGPSL